MADTYQVKRKQQNSKMCLVCGMENTLGLKAEFYELENDDLLAIFQPRTEHQSYPNRMHGGISAAILDETIGRAIMMRDEAEYWGVTVEFSVKYKKPVPLDEPLRVVGRITNERSRIFEGTGEILLSDGTIAVEGIGKYIKQPLEKIAEFDEEEQNWKVIPNESDPLAFSY